MIDGVKSLHIYIIIYTNNWPRHPLHPTTDDHSMQLHSHDLNLAHVGSTDPSCNDCHCKCQTDELLVLHLRPDGRIGMALKTTTVTTNN